MKNDNKKEESLNNAINATQMYNFVNNFENSVKARLKKDIIKTLIMLCVLLSPLIIGMTRENAILIKISFSIIAGASSIKMAVDTIKNGKNKTKKFFSKKYNTSENLEQDLANLETLQKTSIITKKEEDFFSENYKDFFEKHKNDDLAIYEPSDQEKKYMAALEKQKNEDIYTKTNNELVQEYKKYEKIYNLPPYAISNNNWDTIFSTLYEYLKDLSLESEYPYYAKAYLRYSLADALLRNTTEINIDNFINALQYLEMLNFSKKDIHNIQKTLKTSIQEKKSKIININEIKMFQKKNS